MGRTIARRSAIAAFGWRLAGGARGVGAACGATLGINLLALAGPLYVLLLHSDAVLSPSRDAIDAGGFAALTVAMLLAYALAAVFDLWRQRSLAATAARIDRWLCRRVAGERPEARPQAILDLDAIRACLAGPAAGSLLDLPAVPVGLALMVLMHPLLGLLAMIGAAALSACHCLAESGGAEAQRVAHLGARRWQTAMCGLATEAARSPTAPPGAGSEWRIWHRRLRARQEAAGRPAMLAGAVIRAARGALQSGMLGTAAYLAATGRLAPVCVLIAPILLARVLGPMETLAAHRQRLAAGWIACKRLTRGPATGQPAAAQHASGRDRRGVTLIVRRTPPAYARSATGAGRSAVSGLRPTAR